MDSTSGRSDFSSNNDSACGRCQIEAPDLAAFVVSVSVQFPGCSAINLWCIQCATNFQQLHQCNYTRWIGSSHFVCHLGIFPWLLWCTRSDLRRLLQWAWCSACRSVHFADLQRFFSFSICYKLQYSVVATNCPQSPPKLKLLLKYLQCFYYLSISSAVYTKVEDTAVVISGTINNLDLSDASKAGVALLQPVAVLVVPLEY